MNGIRNYYKRNGQRDMELLDIAIITLIITPIQTLSSTKRWYTV